MQMNKYPLGVYEADDSPNENLTIDEASNSQWNLTSIALDDDFEDYLMYLPPGIPGLGESNTWVTIDVTGWDDDGTANSPFEPQMFGGVDASGFSPSNQEPVWSILNGNGVSAFPSP
jgi:hypothetical protein